MLVDLKHNKAFGFFTLADKQINCTGAKLTFNANPQFRYWRFIFGIPRLTKC